MMVFPPPPTHQHHLHHQIHTLPHPYQYQQPYYPFPAHPMPIQQPMTYAAPTFVAAPAPQVHTSENQFQRNDEPSQQITQEDDKYARFQEIIRAANRDLNKTNWTILDDEESDDQNDRLHDPSSRQQGYRQAWDNLERKLESGQLSGEASNQRQYQFEEANPFLASTARDISGLYEEALRDYQQGEVNSAILKLEALAQRDEGRDLAEVWRLLGTCHAENDDEWKAIHSFEKAVDFDPYHLPTLLALGTCYVNELDSIKALETLRCWVTHNPKFVGLEVTSDEYSDGTLMDEVMQLMLSVATHSPHDAEVQVLLGVLYNISLDFDSALQCFDSALQSEGEGTVNYDLLNKLGATLANSNRSPKALPYYARALKERPKFVRGWRNLGIAHANSNEYEPAAKAFLQALQLNPSARYLLSMHANDRKIDILIDVVVRHIWSYLRVVLTCMERMDLVQLSTKEDVRALATALNTELIE